MDAAVSLSPCILRSDNSGFTSSRGGEYPFTRYALRADKGDDFCLRRWQDHGSLNLRQQTDHAQMGKYLEAPDMRLPVLLNLVA